MFRISLSGNLFLLKHRLKPLRLFPPVFQLHYESTPPINSRQSNPVIDEAAQHSRPGPSSLNPRVPPKSQNESEAISSKKRVEMSHPWPEWVELMNKLLNGGYFDKNGHPFGTSELGSMDYDQIRTACSNFARDHVDAMRFLSMEDIEVVAGAGCPSLDRRVVNSGKRLRAYVGIDEGNVCRSCILRGNCARANVKASEDEGGRTIDVMRLLWMYSLDVVIESVENKPCLNKKVNESVRKLLKEVVAYSSDGQNEEQTKDTMDGSSAAKITPTKHRDWTCPKCNFLNFARNVKCLQCEGSIQERIRELNAEMADLPLKKGDWICDTCNFLNFARNTRCLLCKGKPSNREIGPGEWECDSCNYVNFRRNVVCLKCDRQRPKSIDFAPSLSQRITSDNVWRHRTRPYFGHDKPSSKDKGSGDRVNFVGNDLECSNTKKDALGFFDFPVIGGKGEVSQDAHKQETWRMEMAQRNRPAGNDKRENADSK